MSKRELVDEASKMLRSIDQVLSDVTLAERVERTLQTATTGMGHLPVIVDGRRLTSRYRLWRWISEGCQDADCECAKSWDDEADELPLIHDYDLSMLHGAWMLRWNRDIYSYEEVEAGVQTRQPLMDGEG